MFPISPEKEKALKKKLEDLGIFEKDIEESFIRSGGKGGQHVNKVATCVQIRHLPTGTEVKCHKARTQGMNRYYARVLLYEKIESAVKGAESEEAKRIAKIKRQKRKRSKRAKEKMLEEKKHQAVKKAGRSFKPDTEE
ncbi:peptide chain release factor 1 [bacterium BMS3Bbin09]|nr:peptide chain release factor 1 [bacterium BMS3Bbin09]